MPQIPTRENLGPIRVNGRANPAQINPMVAYDIGRAGAAMERAFHEVAQGFASLGEKQQAMDDATWLAQAKIDTLQADDNIRRDTELNAAPDGTGYEQAPMRLKSQIDEVNKRPGGSQEARTKYNLWAAEQGYETGRWAANAAQTRLRDTTLNNLDKRLDTLSSLASANPDRAQDYLKAYEDELNGYTGSAISAKDAELRKEGARSTINKSALISKAIKSPSDFGKALKAIEDTTGAFQAENPETRAKPMVTGAGSGSYDTTEAIANVSTSLETRSKDPLVGLKNISRDAGGSKSYGNFGLNTSGSVQQFTAKYGSQFGLTAKPGTPQFDEQWRNAAGAAPVEMRAAELEWWHDTIGSKVTNNLVRAGVASDVANDPRVIAYFADRSVQQGPESIANHASRIRSAFTAAKGDPVTFLQNMNATDKAHLQSDFPTALSDGTYSEKGNNNRLAGRLSKSLAVTGSPAGPQAPAQAVDVSKLPHVDGTIQPSELFSLSPEDRAAVTRQLAPHLQVEMQSRMEQAVAAIGSKGTQTIITPKEIDDAAPIIGVKNAQKWKDQLDDAKMAYDVGTELKGMTRAERYDRLRQMVPTGNPEDLAGKERQRFDFWRQGITAIEGAIKKDPLKFVSNESESGRQAMKLIAGAQPGQAGTQQRERAFDTLIELQRREGVSPNEVRILAPEQADTIVKSLQDAKTGPAAAIQIEGLRQTYGKHFNQLWGELVDHGAPQTYLALRTATRQGQDALVQSYALEKSLGEGKDAGKKDLLLERAGVKRADLQKAVTDQVTEFTRALEHKDSSLRLIEGYRNATERLSLYYMTQGKSLGDAVRTAGDELYGKNLAVFKNVIMPRDVADGKDAADIKAALSLGGVGKMIGDIEKSIVSNIRPSGNGMFPSGYERQRYINNLKANPQFVTNENATGVYVLDQFGDYVLHDTPQGAVPLMYTWDQLAKAPKMTGYDRLPGAN